MDNLNLVELKDSELANISGGSIIGRLIKGGKALLEIAAAHDAIQSFRDGWENCAPDSE